MIKIGIRLPYTREAENRKTQNKSTQNKTMAIHIQKWKLLMAAN